MKVVYDNKTVLSMLEKKLFFDPVMSYQQKGFVFRVDSVIESKACA